MDVWLNLKLNPESVGWATTGDRGASSTSKGEQGISPVSRMVPWSAQSLGLISSTPRTLGIEAYSCNSSAQEVEVGGSEKFEVILSYIVRWRPACATWEPSLNKQATNRNNHQAQEGTFSVKVSWFKPVSTTNLIYIGFSGIRKEPQQTNVQKTLD